LHCTIRSGKMVLQRFVAAASKSDLSAMSSHCRGFNARCRCLSYGRLAGDSQHKRFPQDFPFYVMAANALLRATSIASLDAAFAHIHSNSTQKSRNSSGVDGQTIAEFASKRSEYISRISKEIRSKHFRYQKLSPHFVKKASGKYRVICVPTIRDRVVQRALNDYLGNRLETTLNNEISFGFLNNKGVEKAVRTACTYRQNYPWAFKTDISAFFDRIDREKCFVSRICEPFPAQEACQVHDITRFP
jgi:hypothetical protein